MINYTRIFRCGRAIAVSLLISPPLILPAAAQAVAFSTTAVRIEKIVFRGNRTSEKLLRSHLPFSEGDPLTASSLQEAQTGLWDMRQFKRVEVSSAASQSGSAEIDITVKDGWYLIPLPFFAGGSGGRRGGLLLFERNIFRQAESVMASAFSGSAGSSAALALRREGWSLSAVSRRLDVIERRYADGAYSASSGFGSPPDSGKTSKYGPLDASYRKGADETSLALGLPLTRASVRGFRLSAAFGWEGSTLRYSSPAPVMPADPGSQGQAFISLRAGADGGGAADAMGAIFGFGLADMARRIAPLPVHKFSSGAEAAYHRGAAWTGSDFSYGYLQAKWDGTLTWGTHRSLSLRLAGGTGEDLPPNRLLATGRETALTGGYAREFRGASAAGASVIYSHPFRTTGRGMWQGSLFAEAARAWGAGPSGAKTGAGASFWYKFWRFPLPLGFSYTYSFDDRDVQVSAALGGRF